MNFVQTRTANITRFGRGGQLIRARNGQGLDLEEIAQATPSVFADDKHHTRSAKYTFISTLELLQGMIKEGFAPYEVRQGGSKFEDKRAYTKHQIRFRHARDVGPAGKYYSEGRSAFGIDAKVGDAIQEVIISNSHDGTSQWEAFSGWFKIACLNGLIVAAANMEKISIKIPHKGNVLNDVVDASFRIIDGAGEQVRQIEHMQAVPLAVPEQLAFAEAAAALRWEEGERPKVTLAQVNHARREVDARGDLWTTFNRVQENLVRGGLDFVRRQDVRNADGNVVGQREVQAQTRPVYGIDGDVKLNRALWILAAKMAELKG